MNTLSWLLYASDAFGSAKTASVVILIACGFTGLFAAIFSPIISEYTNAVAFVKKAFRPFLWTASIALGVAILVPSQNTIMLIAASEAGEQILSSAKAQEIGGEAGGLATDSIKLLRKYINDQLGKDAPKP